jgi:hypothetical protein
LNGFKHIISISIVRLLYVLTNIWLPHPKTFILFFQIQCQAVNEEEIHAVLSEQSLYPAGWIHVCIPALPYFMYFVFLVGLIEIKKITCKLPVSPNLKR